MDITAPRGTNDIMPYEVRKWQYLEEQIRSICRRYDYKEIRTPIFEETVLFQRGIGDITDIVEKEMYTFIDRAERSMTLRPEGTAPVVRSYLEHKMYGGPQPIKLYYMGPMFRYERPQAGRYRQFHQFGAEVIGACVPEVDAEVIDLAMHLYYSLGLDELELQINSIGCPLCRGKYREVLRAALAGHRESLCSNCARRYERNPLRMLDCKEKRCKEIMTDIPSIHEYLCDECADHFQRLQGYLNALSISYVINPKLVRGFDYYAKTVFEVIYRGLGAQDAIGGGGRYDGLIETYGGPSTPAVGFAAGIERILLTLERLGKELPFQSQLDVYMIILNEAGKKLGLPLLKDIRGRGFKADIDYMGRSLKSQMKAANRRGARFVVIIGEDELSKGKAIIRNMKVGTEEEVPFDEVVERFIEIRLETDQGVLMCRRR